VDDSTFASLYIGQPFLVPAGEAGANCLWIKTGAKSAKSWGRSNYGSCAFNPSDKIEEIIMDDLVDLIIENRSGFTK